MYQQGHKLVLRNAFHTDESNHLHQVAAFDMRVTDSEFTHTQSKFATGANNVCISGWTQASLNQSYPQLIRKNM